MSGYVRIHRTLLGHPAFRNESETMAFAWLVAKAAWKTTRVRYKGHSIKLGRGQLAISQRDMAAAFDRDKAWIERLWKRLNSEDMIGIEVEAGVTVVTICNYAQFQADADVGEALNEARVRQGSRSSRGGDEALGEANGEAVAASGGVGITKKKAGSADSREAVGEAVCEADVEAGVRQRRGTEQGIEKDNKIPPTPKGDGKTALPIDWIVPSVSDLPPQAAACAALWTDESYARHGEAFISYWRSSRKKMGDWRLTWANRIVALHAQVMREQSFAAPKPTTGGSTDFLDFKIAERKRIEAFEASQATR